MVRSFFHPVLVRSKIRLAESDADKVVEMILNETIPLEWRKTLLSSLVKEKERAEKEKERAEERADKDKEVALQSKYSELRRAD